MNSKYKLYYYQSILNRYKSHKGCVECGYKNHKALDLHHKNPNEKIQTIARLLTYAGWKTIKSEVFKCIVLCSNCHRIHHYNDRQTERKRDWKKSQKFICL